MHTDLLMTHCTCMGTQCVCHQAIPHCGISSNRWGCLSMATTFTLTHIHTHTDKDKSIIHKLRPIWLYMNVDCAASIFVYRVSEQGFSQGHHTEEHLQETLSKNRKPVE